MAKLKDVEKLDDPNDVQVEIRMLYWEINDLENVSHKNELKRELSVLAKKAFDKELTEMLQNSGLFDTALDLVLDCISTITDLAKKLFKLSSDNDSDKKSYKILKQKLGSKLETRGALACNGIDTELEWAATLIRECPSVRVLQGKTFSHLSKILENADINDRFCIEKIYCEGNDIRKQCRSYGLSLTTSEELEQKGITDISQMSDCQLRETLGKIPKNRRCLMKRMYSDKRPENLKDKEEQRQKLENYKKQIEEAQALVETIRRDAREVFKENKDKFESRMKDIAAKAKLPQDWIIQNLENPDELLESVEKSLNIATEKLSICSYNTHEEVVAAASGGLARHGINFLGDDSEELTKRPPFPILKKPDYVEWLSPTRGYEVSYFKSTLANASSLFYKLVKSSGLSIAASVYIGYYGSSSVHFNSETSDETENRSHTSSTYASVTKYIVHPTKAFRLPREEMQLENEPRLKAKNITDLNSARDFLSKYGSHVPAGLHTLGGVFFSTVTVTTKEKTETAVLTNAAANQLGAEVSARAAGLRGLASASAKTEYFKSSGSNDVSANKTREGHFEMTVKTLGPATTNPNIFDELLQSNNATWFVIDRGDQNSLVPVWEIIGELGDKYAKPALLIKRAWETKNLSRLSRNKEVGDPASSYGDKSKAIEIEISEMKKYIRSKSLVTEQQPDMCFVTLVDIFLRIRTTEQTCKTLDGEENVMAIALEIPSFVGFMKNVATKPEHNFGTAQKLIRTTIKPAEIKGQVCLDPDLLTFLEASSTAAADVKELKEITIENLAEELNKLGEKLEYEGMDSTTGNREAASLLQAALSIETNEELRAALENLAISVGYKENVCDFETILGPNELSILAEKISKILLANFETGMQVKYTFQCTEEELGSGQIEAVGSIGLVKERNAFVLWNSLTNNTTGKTWTRQKQTEQWNRKWMGGIMPGNPENYFKPMKNGQLPCQIPFWKLELYSQQNNAKDSTASYRGIRWRQTDSKPKVMPSFTVADFCVDKQVLSDGASSSQDIVHLLCRRMDAFKKTVGPESWEDEDFWSDDDSTETEDNNLDPEFALAKTDPFSLLLEQVSKCNLSAKMRLFDMLLQQRYTIPLIIQTSSGKYSYNVGALRLVSIKLFSDVIELLNDTSLPRIAFVSRRPEGQTENRHLVKNVLNCNVTSSVSDHAHGTIAELGVGFLKDDSKEGNCDPWLIANVRGDFKPLWTFVTQFADVVIVELNPDDSRTVEVGKQGGNKKAILRWKNRNDLEKAKKFKKPLSIEGSFHGVADLLEIAIRQYRLKIKPEDHLVLLDITLEGNQVENEIMGLNEMERRIEKFNFDELRQKLRMQNSFVRQCEIEVEMKRIRANIFQLTHKSDQVDQEMKFRLDMADGLMQLPLIKQFHSLLNEPDSDLRVIGIQQFANYVNKRSDAILKKEKVSKDSAWEYYSENPKDSDALQLYYRAKKDYTNKSISVIHCWRELSHIYSAKPGMYPKLPLLAAQYLLDGFSLEILDGDAGSVNIEWFKKVMLELNDKLMQTLGHEPKVFVVSVMGTQSTGKSTLLNTMFGCQLQTSSGQCTRGVHLQLARAENREGIDYVLIMDTEGIRSPEFFGTEDSVSRDNRMATFAVLPANACIVTTVNEEDSAIKEVLPIVMLAFKGSNIAQESAGRLSSLLFFVYCKVGTSPRDLVGFEENRRQLVTELQSAADKIAGSKIAGSNSSSDTDTLESDGKNLKKFLAKLQISKNEAKSDVKYIGLLNKGEKPPDDIPNFEYGKKVHQLSEYMHKRRRQCALKSQTLKGWIEYLELVIKCINTSDFELHFKTALQFQSYNDLQDKLYDVREELSKRYCDTYNTIERDLLTAEQEPRIDDLIEKLNMGVAENDREQTTVVKKLLDRKEFVQFKTDELRQWNYFKSDRQRTWEQLLRDAHETKWKFDKQEEQLEIGILTELRKQWEKNQSNLMDELQQLQLFCGIFNEHLAKSRKLYPPLNVEQKIREEYAQGVKQFDIGISSTWLQVGLSIMAESFDKFLKCFGIKDKSDLQEIARELKSNLTERLRSVKRYNGKCVSDAIKYTNEVIEKHDILIKVWKKRLHQVVFTILVEKFKYIQKEWDKTNNVTAKLENSRNRLLEKFKNICKGFVGAQSVAADVTNALKQAYLNAYKHYLAYEVFQKVKNKAWVRSPVIMQAHIELDLIAKIKRNEIEDVLKSVYDSPNHYSKVLTTLIVQHIKKEISGNEPVESIKTAVITATTKTTSIEHYKDSFGSSFRKELTQYLHPEMLKNFPAGIWDEVAIQEKSHGLSKRDWIEIGAVIEKNVEQWKQEECPLLSEEELSKLVKHKLETERGSTTTSPRCSTPCPRCKMLCINSSGHETYEQSDRRKLHHTHHQPQGICGRQWIKSRQLCEITCKESFANGCFFKHNGKFMLYKDWCKIFPSWALPNIADKTHKLLE